MDPFASALDQAAAVRRREVSARELVDMYLERIERCNPALNAYVHLTPELARAQAAEVEAKLAAYPGPLAGVPISVKDQVSVAGHPTTLGARALRDNVFDVDSFVVTRIREEGLPILGKTNMSEFGSRPVTEYGLFGAAHNPWNLEHTTGGSSGGAAGALAAGLCAISNAHDGGGSTRIPAACCGLVGLKPSRGRISEGPLVGDSWAGLATNGVIARTVADAAAGLDVMEGHMMGDPYWADSDGPYVKIEQPGRLRVGFDWSGVDVDPEVRAAVAAAAKAIEGLGHGVEPGGPDTSGLLANMTVIVVGSVALIPVEGPEELDPFNQLGFQLLPMFGAGDYVRAVENLRMISRQVVSWWESHDVLVLPTIPTPAPRIGTLGADVNAAPQEYLEFINFVQPWNATGQPAISLPLGMSSSGLPIGVQLVGPPRGERVILALAAQLEQAMPWSDRRPAGY